MLPSGVLRSFLSGVRRGKSSCHCVRASTVPTLLQANVDPTLIMQVTKHKNIGSLQHYISDLSDKQQRNTSNILSVALSGTNEATTSEENGMQNGPEGSFAPSEATENDDNSAEM